MGKLSIFILFIFHSVAGYAQTDTLFVESPLDFYPLNIGDIRHYENEFVYYYQREYYYFSEKVLKDTLIDDMNYKKIKTDRIFVTSSGDTLLNVYTRFERIDTLSYTVYQRNSNSEGKIICLNAQPGDSCGEEECSILFKDLFSRIREVKEFKRLYTYDGWAAYDLKEIAAYLGVIFKARNSGTMKDTYTLKYAFLNGIEYGTPIPILENLYQEDSTASEDDSTSIESKPEIYILYQNYPNPFNSYTTISYDLPFSTNVQIEIYDILGRSVQTLVNKEETVGKHIVEFDASNLGSGIYMYKIHTENYTQVKKMLLIK